MDEVVRSSVCPICAGDTFRSYKLGLLQCAVCELVLSPSIWQRDTNNAMEEEFFGESYMAGSSVWVELFEAWNNRRTLARLATAYPPGRRFLEIGVGSGSLLDAARSAGYEVVGCDLSEPICRQVRLRYGITVHNSPAATLLGNSRFDMVVMNHVLEHANQPMELLRDVEQLLTPGGFLHIVVPNIGCWEASLPGWVGYEPYHLTYFTPQTLNKTLSATGLSIAYAFTCDSFSGWFLALLRTLFAINRTGAVTRSLDPPAGRVKQRPWMVEHCYRMIMVLFGGGVCPLRWIQARLGRGDEIVCMARKQDVVKQIDRG